MTTRTSLYRQDRINGRYPGLPLAQPPAPNILWDADSPLSSFDALEFWLAPDIGAENAGFPVRAELDDGFFRGEDEDPSFPIVLDYKAGRGQRGHIFVQRHDDRSMSMWVDGAQVPPFALIEVFGIEAISGFIEPKNRYGPKDNGKFLIDHGVLEKIENYRTVGHGKTVGGTDSPGVWLELGAGGDEGGGAGQHFRGWHARASGVTNPVADDFFIDYNGYFERYYDGAGVGGTGWRFYNPFEGGEYWNVITDSGGNPFRVTEEGYTAVATLTDAFDGAEESGDAFAATSSRQIVVAETVVKPLASHSEYRPVPYVPPRGALRSPTAIFWGLGQTSADAAMADKLGTAFNNGYQRLEFVRNEPDDEINGGADLGIRFLDAADVSADASFITEGGTDDETAATDHKWFILPAGDYEVELAGRFGVKGNDSTFACRLVQVTSGGADATIAVDAKGERTASPSPFASTEEEVDTTLFVRKRITIDAPQQFSFIAGPFLTTTDLRQSAYVLTIKGIA